MNLIKSILLNSPISGFVKSFRKKKNERLRDKHNQEMLIFYSQFVSHGNLVFDVGANEGNRSNIFLKLGAKVVAIEPQDECTKVLKSCYGKNENFILIQKVLGSSIGEAELMVSNVSTISSLSPDWIKAVRSSGRFKNHSWENKEIVQMTTLDQLIKMHGIPAFIKIDVEGYENEVIAGLSSPIEHISLEFTPEFIESTFDCIDHLESIGEYYFNYSLGESMQIALSEHVTSREIKEILNSYSSNSKVFGDIYCKCITPC